MWFIIIKNEKLKNFNITIKRWLNKSNKIKEMVTY